MLIIDKAKELIKNKNYDCKGNSKKCYYFSSDGKEYALLVYKCDNIEKNNLRLQCTNYLKEKGLSTPNIVGIDYSDGFAYEVQDKCNGKIMSFRNEELAGSKDKLLDNFLDTLKIIDNADSSTFIKLMSDARLIHINGYALDCHSDNFMIDKDGNITFIDIDIYKKPKLTNDNFRIYVNVMPFIFSYTISNINDENKDKFSPLLKSVGYKWFEQCINYLSSFDLTPDEITNIVSMISFNYFMIDKEEKNNMINDYSNSFNTNKEIKSVKNIT